MHLFTVQPRWVFNELQEKGIFLAQPQLDTETFIGDPICKAPRVAYDWLCTQMERRGLAQPSPSCYPIWAWQQCYGKGRNKPDLRTRLFKSWSKTERYVLFTVEVPDKDVLLSSYDMWHMPLNYSYLGPEPDVDDFLARAKAKGHSPYKEIPLQDAQLHEELITSWEQIFDLDRCVELSESVPEHCPVQATFWALRKDQILEAKEFGAGLPPKLLPL